MNNFRTFDVVINLTRENTPEPDIKPKKAITVQCEEVTFTCNYCDKLYFDKEELRKHIEQHMKNDNKLKCDLCNIGFSRKTYLTEHYCIHTGEKPHACYYCGKSFSLRCNLIRHSRIHTGEKRFPCDQCDHRFILKKNLIEHLRTHTGEKPFKCKTCDRPFGRRSSLVRHVRTHTGEKKFVCHICNKNFAWKYYLQRHMAVHLNGNNRRSPENGAARRTRKVVDPLSSTNVCETCGKNFKTKRTLEKHAKLHEDNYVYMKKTVYDEVIFCLFRCQFQPYSVIKFILFFTVDTGRVRDTDNERAGGGLRTYVGLISFLFIFFMYFLSAFYFIIVYT